MKCGDNGGWNNILISRVLSVSSLESIDIVRCDLIKLCFFFCVLFLLKQAKKLVEALPQEIRANVSKEEAEKLKAALEAAGGTVVLE